MYNGINPLLHKNLLFSINSTIKSSVSGLKIEGMPLIGFVRKVYFPKINKN